MTSNLPIPRATLEEMERNRARAIDLYAEAFDILQQARKFAGLATISGKTNDGVTGLAGAEFNDAARDALAPRYSYSESDREKRREKFVCQMTQQIDRAMWGHIIRACDLEKFMDKQAHDDFRNGLSVDPPAAVAENVRATLKQFMADADLIFRRGIANAFSKLDRRFRSHDGFKIGSRIVLSYCFSRDYSGWSTGRHQETIRDIERTFHVLDDRDVPSYDMSVVSACSGMRGMQWEIDTDYFRIRRFKNGNAHLWFTRPDLMRRVNLLLADYYGEAIGEGSEVADVSEMGPGYHVTPARNLGFFETDEATARRLFERAYNQIKDMHVLEPSAGRGALADMAKDLGAASVHCVELDVGRSAELRAKGYPVTTADFTTLAPTDVGLFDVVVMNPPFDRGRDCDHVRHALQFLKPGGLLLAIMSAGAETREDSRTTSFRALVEKCKPLGWNGRFFLDLPEGSFAHAGTMVNTITLALRTPSA